jgi:hypothetical protein
MATDMVIQEADAHMMIAGLLNVVAVATAIVAGLAEVVVAIVSR